MRGAEPARLQDVLRAPNTPPSYPGVRISVRNWQKRPAQRAQRTLRRGYLTPACQKLHRIQTATQVVRATIGESSSLPIDEQGMLPVELDRGSDSATQVQ